MSKLSFSQPVEGADVIKWCKGDGRIAICTSNVIYVLTPSALLSATSGGRGTRQPPLTESFTITVAEMPPTNSQTDLFSPLPESILSKLSQETHRDEDSHSLATLAVDPLYCGGVGAFVGCQWCPLYNATGPLLCGLTSRGHLYLFKPPAKGLKAWKMVHSISDVLSAMATTQNGRSGESTALGNLPQKSPKPAYLPQKSPKPAYLPQRSHSSAHQLPESPIPAHQNSHTSQKDCSAVTAYSWQCKESNNLEARLAVGTRSGHVIVFDVTSHVNVTSDSLSTHVSEQLVCRAKVPILLSHRILCMAWTGSTVQGSQDCTLAVGCSDGSLWLLHTTTSEGVVVCYAHLTDGHAEVDQIPICHLLWLPSRSQGSSGRLLFSKGTAIGVASIASRALEGVAFVVGGHSFPVAGVTEVHTAHGMQFLSVGMDGTAQLFDPWGVASPIAGGGALKVLKSETVSLESPIQPPKTLVRGVAASGNGVYFTTVCCVQGYGGWEKPKTEVYFQSLLTPAEVEKDFCTPGSYLRPTLFTTPITASASASNVWDALHLLLGSAPAEEEGKSPALAHMLASLGEPKTSPHLASLIHQVARAYGKDKLVGEADSVTMVTHVQKSLSDWLKWHKTTDRSPATLRVLRMMANWLLRQKNADIAPAQHVMSEAMATGLSEVDMQSPCAVCGMEVPPVDGTSGVGKEVCPQGHSVARCCLTLCVLSALTGKQCHHCKAWVGLPTKDGGPWLKALLSKPHCLLCGGPVSCVL